ncbi:adenosylmethionine decarboxylase [bacterium]|nr:MAG: adenosylmethionine decarboxylase [bacterium]
MKAKARNETYVRGKKRLRGPEPRVSLGNDSSRRLYAISGLGGPGKNQKALGTQLLIEMRDCLTDRLDDLEWVREVLVESARRAHATIVDILFHKFSPVGISGVIVIAESHIAIHTWPEYRYAAVDIFSCGKKLRGSEAVSYLIGQFRSASPSVVEVQRGLFSPRVVHRAPPMLSAS